MMETAIVDGLVNGGPVALLAFLIFYMYRKDRKDTESRIHDVHDAHSDRLEFLLEKDQESREHQTKALTELSRVIEQVNGKSS